MKKLKLKALELGASEVLTREQLKNVLGGDGSGGGSGGSCFGTYFYSGDNGCEYVTCHLPGANPGDCFCQVTITTPPPCGNA